MQANSGKKSRASAFFRSIPPKKLKYIAASVILSLVIIAGIITAVAYSIRLKGWEQNISVQSFTFSMNDLATGTITSNDMRLLAHGQEADFTLKVEAKGYATHRFSVPYTIDLSFDTTDASGNALARATEVYSFENGEYKYLCMLNEFITAGVEISGSTGINGPTYHRYRLVYSPAAGSYYEGKSFTITALAEYTNPVYDSSNYYIYSVNDVINAATYINGYDPADNDGAALPALTLVLLHDVTLTQNVTFNEKIGIDLNGHVLNTGAYSLAISYDDSYTDSTSDWYSLFIGDSTGGGSVGGGGITVTASNDIIPVDDSFADDAKIQTGTFSSTALASHVADAFAKACETPLSGSAASFEFAPRLKRYLLNYSIVTNLADTSVLSALNTTTGDFTVNASLDRTMPSANYIQFSVAGVSISGTLDILGTGAYAIAQNIIDSIPDVITSSLFFPAADSSSLAHITWVTSDKSLITADGVFLPDGYESFSDWTNRSVTIGIIVEVPGQDKYTAVIDREIGILTPAERTRIIYDYSPILLREVGNKYNLYSHITDVLNASSVSKLGFTGARIVINVTDEDKTINKNYTADASSKWYVDYDATGLITITHGGGSVSCETVLEMMKTPENIGALITGADITFYYADTNGTESSYTFARPVTVIGPNSAVTLDDPTVFLQTDFTENVYTSDKSGENFEYSFLVNASYNGSRVDYFVNNDSDTDADTDSNDTSWDDDDIVEIVNGLFIPSDTGAFYYDGTDFQVYDTEDPPAGSPARYDRKALIIVKPGNVKNYTDTAYISAKLQDGETVQSYSSNYTYDQYFSEAGTYKETAASQSYLQESGADLEYTLTLAVEGLYHNISTEIADGNLYVQLCRYYDTNGDGYISVNEALLANPTGSSTASVNGAGNVKYISLTNADISSLKGIEYFVNLTGIDISSNQATGAAYNSVIDISYLAGLSKLQYIKMRNNLVTDISPLEYLDNLVYIDFMNNEAASLPQNNITDLEPIRYLTGVNYLNLAANSGLSDVGPISDYSDLRFLDVRISGLSSVYNQYYLTLIYDNCSAHFGSGTGYGIYYVYGSTDAYTPAETVVNAALAMKNLTVINETFNTLNLQTAVTMDETVSGTETTTKYYIHWGSSNPSYLNFTSTTGAEWGATDNYVIVSPIVNLPTDIVIYVSSSDNAATAAAVNADYFNTIARKFTVNLLQLSGYDNITYIQRADGTVGLASSVVPDDVLRGSLFATFNYDSSASDYVYVDPTTGALSATSVSGYVAISQDRIITQSDISSAYAANNSIGVLSYRNLGICDLTGIENFKNGITSLDLRGNVITKTLGGKPDISGLASLSKLTSLYLDGQSYDFTMLSKFSESTFTGYTYTAADPNGTGGTIYGSGLTSLTSLSVYGSYDLDSSSVQAALYQVYLMNKNVSIYSDSASTAWDPYALPLAAYLREMPSTFTYVTLGQNTNCLYVDDNGAVRVNVTTLDSYYCYEFRFYDVRSMYFRVTRYSNASAKDDGTANVNKKAVCGLKGDAGNATDGTTIGITSAASAFITGFNYKSHCAYSDTVYSSLTVSSKEYANFTGSTGRSETVSGVKVVEQKLEFNYHIKLLLPGLEDTAENYVSLTEIFPGRTLLSKVLGALTYNTSSYPNGRITVKTGSTTSYLYPVTPAAGTVNSDDVYFKMASGQLISIGTSADVNGLYIVGGQSAIQGMQYTTVTTLNIGREAILGNGEWLTNLTALTISYSAVDLSTLTTELPKLTTFVIGTTSMSATTQAKACWLANLYDSDAVNISDTSTDIYKSVVGLLDSTNTSSSVQHTAADYASAGSLQMEAVTSTDITGEKGYALYAKLREIARSKDADGHYYFYLNYMPNLQNIRISYTSVFDWTGFLSFLFRYDSAAEAGAGEYTDPNDIANIIINGGYTKRDNAIDFYTRNSNGGICEPIIRKIYEAYVEEHGTTPTYKIGTMASYSDTGTVYEPIAWHGALHTNVEDILDSNGNIIHYYTEYEADRTVSGEKAEFASSVVDFGVRLGTSGAAYTAAVNHYDLTEQTAAAGTVIYLPMTTHYAAFGTVTNDEFLRDFAISWTDAAGNTYTSSPADIDGDGTDDCYTYTVPSVTSDTYIFFKGTCSAAGVSYIYPVLELGSAAYDNSGFASTAAAGKVSYAYSASSVSYREITDNSLRLMMFILNGKAATIDPSSFASIDNTAASLSAYSGYIGGISTLDGLEIFCGSLTSLKITGNFISDTGSLSCLTGLLSIDLSKNLVNDVSWLSGMSSLTELILTDNAVKKTYTTSGSTDTTLFPASLTTLKISGNDLFSTRDISALKTVLVNLTTLEAHYTSASHDRNAVEYIYDLLTLSGKTLTLTLSGTSANSMSATAAALSAALGYIDGTTADDNYKSLIGYSGSSAFTRTNGVMPSTAGVDVSVLNSYVGTDKDTWIAVSQDIDVNLLVTFGTYGGTAYNGAVSVYAAGTVTNGVTADSLRRSLTFEDGSVVNASELDTAVYGYILANLSSFGGTISGTDPTINFTAVSGGRTITVDTDAGITSLKGTEKIPLLTTVRIEHNPVTELGFVSSNSSVTSLTVAYSAMTESGAASLDMLTALTAFDFSKVGGIDYTAAVGSTSIADILSGISSLTSIRINNTYNYFGAAAADLGITSDAQWMDSASSFTFGVNDISDYARGVLSVLVGRTGCLGGVTGEKYYADRTHTSLVYTVDKWWSENTYASAFNISAFAAPASADYSRLTKFTTTGGSDAAWVNLLKYLSEISVGSSAAANGITQIPSTLYYADFSGTDLIYGADRSSITFTLPSTFCMFGETYTVTWTAKLNSATDKTASLIDSTGDYTAFTFSSSNDAVNFVNNDIITLTGVCSNGKAVTHAITIYRDNTASTKYYQALSSDDNLLTSFYIEMEDGQIVPAAQFFDSYRLLNWIFNHQKFGNSSNAMRNSSNADVSPVAVSASGRTDLTGGRYIGKYVTLEASGKYFRYSDVLSVASVTIGTSSSANIGVISLEGIQLFKNISSLNLVGSYYMSIEPLSNLHLASFEYSNDTTNVANPIIQDWSPLYNSRDTLTTFKYGTGAKAVYGDDFSFLMSFPNLTTITIGSSDCSTNLDKIPGFRYMLAWFYINNRQLTVTFSGSVIYRNGSYSDGAITAEEIAAAQILSSFISLDSSGFVYKNNYELQFKNGFDASGTTSATLPGYISAGGKKYYIEWISMSSYLTVATTGAHADETDYFDAASAGTWTVTLKNRESNYLNTTFLIARVRTDDGILERVFTIKCADDYVYPSIHLLDNFASYTLPSGSVFTAYTGMSSYYSISSLSSCSTVTLTAAAVGNDVYINVDGVKTKLEFNLDAAYFTELEALHTAFTTTYTSAYITANFGVDNYNTANGLLETIAKYRDLKIGKYIWLETTYPDDISAMNTAYAALVAQRTSVEALTVAITYDGYNSGAGYTNTNISLWSASLGTRTLQPARKDGYSFGGWYEEAALTTAVTSMTFDYMKDYYSSGLTLYPKFTEINMTVAYADPDSLGYTNNPANPSSWKVTDGEITLGNPSVSGYTFEGWYTKAPDSGVYDEAYLITALSNATVKKYYTAGTITLYPKFTVTE